MFSRQLCDVPHFEDDAMNTYRVQIVDRIKVVNSVILNAENVDEAVLEAQETSCPPFDDECERRGYIKLPKERMVVKIEKIADEPTLLIA